MDSSAARTASHLAPLPQCASSFLKTPPLPTQHFASEDIC